ncbi:hypothetical protein MiSe_16280 [Microseira wollei NIES-4236]|uniref:Uncharacterized protein n=1 Tax=Microseira wollei NIES-4236 TaxID=2530354 RepID=A0AAV3X6F3_9CYAN|nr:hypothetical protein MiSe_16280 [Microseira wollei NIES-4236]
MAQYQEILWVVKAIASAGIPYLMWDMDREQKNPLASVNQQTTVNNFKDADKLDRF